MPFRKLTRGGSEVNCGAEKMVSGGTPDPLGQVSRQKEDCGSEAMVSGGIADPLGKEQQGGEQQDGMQQAGHWQAGQQQTGQQQGGPQQGRQQQAGQKQGGLKLGEQQLGGQQDGIQWSPPSRQRLEQAAGEVIAALHAAKQELAKEMEANLKQLKAVLQETQRIAKEMEAVLKEAKAEPDPEELARGGRQGQQGKPAQAPWEPPGYNQKAKQQDGQDRQDEEQQAPPPWQPPAMDEQAQQQAQ